MDSADTQVMDRPAPVLERIDGLLARADELLALTVDGRTMFSATEVLDFALDARMALVDARNHIVPTHDVPTEITN